MNNVWQSVAAISIDKRPACWSWLVDPGSLTERVRKLESNEPFHLDVLYEAQETLDAACAELLGLVEGVSATIREVSLNRGATPVIFARSVIPVCSTEGANSWLAELGNQPLGDALFDAENLKRSEFEVNQLDETNMLYERIICSLQRPDKPVWARRSRVTINDQPILINECFLSIPTN